MRPGPAFESRTADTTGTVGHDHEHLVPHRAAAGGRRHDGPIINCHPVFPSIQGFQ